MENNNPEIEVVKEEVAQPKTRAEIKQQERLEKKNQSYWRATPSRAEVVQMVQKAIEDEREKLRGVYILAKGLSELLIEKGVITIEELDTSAKKVASVIYGEPKKASEGTDESVEDTKEFDEVIEKSEEAL